MALLKWSVCVTCLLMTSYLPFTAAVGDVEKICNSQCSDEGAKEAQCAYERGCYEPGVKNDSARITECLDYCWTSAGRCFALCSDNFNSLLNECYQSGFSVIESALACFTERFLELKNQTLGTTNTDISALEGSFVTSEEERHDEGTYVFKPYASTLSLSSTLKTLLTKENKVDASLAEAAGYRQYQNNTEDSTETTDSEQLQDSPTEDFTEDFIAFRKVFLKNASQIQKKLDASLEKEVLKHILSVYQPLQNEYKDEFGIEHVARRVRGNQ